LNLRRQFFADLAAAVGQIFKCPGIAPHDGVKTQKAQKARQRNLVWVGGESVAGKTKKE